MLLLLGVACILAGSGALASQKQPDRVSGEEARRQILTYIQEIQNWSHLMSARYNEDNAEDYLRVAFRQAGVKDAMAYVGSWGGHLYTGWAQTLPVFYNYHEEQLKQSLDAAKGGVPASDMAYLARGMAAWRDKEYLARHIMEHEVAWYLHQAQLHDRLVKMTAQIEAADYGAYRDQLEVRRDEFKQAEENYLKDWKKYIVDTKVKLKQARLFSAISDTDRIEPPALDAGVRGARAELMDPLPESANDFMIGDKADTKSILRKKPQDAPKETEQKPTPEEEAEASRKVGAGNLYTEPRMAVPKELLADDKKPETCKTVDDWGVLKNLPDKKPAPPCQKTYCGGYLLKGKQIGYSDFRLFALSGNGKKHEVMTIPSGLVKRSEQLILTEKSRMVAKDLLKAIRKNMASISEEIQRIQYPDKKMMVSCTAETCSCSGLFAQYGDTREEQVKKTLQRTFQSDGTQYVLERDYTAALKWQEFVSQCRPPLKLKYNFGSEDDD